MGNLNRTLKLVCATVIALSSSYAMACTCMYGGKFEIYSSSNPVIVRGTILSYGAKLRTNDRYFETVTIEISDIVKGNFQHSRVELQGDTGMSCFKYISSAAYPIGSEHLFSLSSNEPLQPLWGCGESSVQISGSVAEGIDGNGGGFYKIDLNELINLVR